MEQLKKDNDPKLLSWLIVVGFIVIMAAALPGLWVAWSGKDRYAGRAMASHYQLTHLAIAFHNYEGVHGRLPPAALYSKDGRPLLSWRVLILPYLNPQNHEDELYREFDLTAAWDSPHNLALLPHMPAVYGFHHRASPDPLRHHTYFQALVGKGAAFEGKEGLRLADFTDGVSQTLLLVEGGEPVPWTKPEDIRYDPDLPLPKLDTIRPGMIEAAYADGHAWYHDLRNPEATIRALITRNGGEQVSLQYP